MKMYKIDKDAFRRYFFWGDGNPEESLEGMMFYAYENVFFDKYMLAKHERMTEEELVWAFVNCIKPFYVQYCRFIELNYKCGVTNYLEVDEETIEKRIFSKIEELKNTDEVILSENDIQNVKRIVEEIREKIDKEKQKMQELEKKDELSEEAKKVWEELIREQKQKLIRFECRKRRLEENTKKLIVKDQDIYYSNVQRARFGNLPEGTRPKIEYMIYDKNNWKEIPNDLSIWYPNREMKEENQEDNDKYKHHKSKHWAIVLAELLQTLGEIEKDEPKAYKDMWLRTRLNMAKHGKIEGITKEEIENIEKACEELRQERLKEEEKDSEHENMEAEL